MHSVHYLDVRALEMQAVDELIDQILADKLIQCDVHGLVTRVPILCAYYRTPVFRSSQDTFYRLVIDAFEKHPRRHDQIPWATTPAIYDVEFSQMDAPVIGQISTIKDPLS